MAEGQLETPVVLVIFNRPETTAQVFRQIAAARPRTLLVVADGPRPDRPGEAERCTAARAVVEQIDWPCELLTESAPTNLGCRERVASGLTWAFGLVEEAIVLEDDCVPHPSFFSFCEQLLAHYRSDERIAMIGGSNHLLQTPAAGSYLFSRYFNIWGWATWRRAWRQMDLEMAEWPRFRAERALAAFYPTREMQRYFDRLFEDAYRGRVDTWDIAWFYSCLFNSGLSAVPRVNLVSNIGVEGTHTSRIVDAPLPVFSLDTANLVHPPHVCPSVDFDVAFFERRVRRSLAKRARLKLEAVQRSRAARTTDGETAI